MKFSHWKNLAREDERGIALGTVILLVSGFALVALTVTLWIGNTTAGAAADVAGCVSRANAANGVTPDCAENGATGAGGGHAAAANNSRPMPAAGWINHFGAGTGTYDTAKLNRAQANFERGLLRFAGLKSRLYADVQSTLTQLRNAGSKEAALAALQQLRMTITTAQEDGETSTSQSTIQVGADLLKEINHPGADRAQEAQIDANQGNVRVRAALTAVNNAISNYSTLSLAQLRAVADTANTELQQANTRYANAVVGLNDTLEIVNSNR